MPRNAMGFRTCVPLLVTAGLMAAGLMTSAAIGQPPFERREAQAPLENPVEVEARIMAGDSWTYHFGLNQTTTTQRQTEDRQDDGPLQNAMLIQNSTLDLRVVELDDETGTATIEIAFQRLLTIVGGDDGQAEFRWARGDDEPTSKTDLDRVLTALVGSTLTARVSPKGTVRGIVGFDAVNEAFDEDPGADRAVLGLFSPTAFGSTLEMIWKPGAVSGTSRNVQDEWTSDRRASLGAVGAIAVDHALQVDRIESGVLTASGEASMRVLPPSRESGEALRPTVELLRDGGRMKISWDLERGCAASASERLDLGAFWTLGPVHLGVTMRSERSASLQAPPKENRVPGPG